MEKIVKSKTLYKVLSLLIAIVLWIYVSYQEMPDSSRWLYDVPITIVGADTLDQNGLYVLETDRTTVDVKLEGPRADLPKVATGDITARLDVSAIEAAGTTSLTCDISVNKKNIDVASARHNSITVTAEKITTDLFPVSIDISGTPAAGYTVFEPSVYPTEVTVRGAESLVNSVASVSTKSVSTSHVTRSNTVNVGLTAFDANGKAISGLTFEPSSVEVSYIVLREKSVSLNIPLRNVPAEKRVTYDPQTIKIYGDIETLANITEISCDAVDVHQLSDGETLSLPLSLPGGVYAEGGELIDVIFNITDVALPIDSGEGESNE
ncbi:MAG: hypothetical protein J1F63_02875 [Oscillospiraceae bacterium]|nr:hypothetical protein [Oscillospiraceae bacterium]